MQRERKNKRRLAKKEKRKEISDLKIYSPYGRLIFTLKPGNSVNYNELLRKKRQEYGRYEGN